MQTKIPSSDVCDMFNRISPTYDLINRILSFGRDLRWRRRLAQHIPLRAHLQVLDVATGTGDQLAALLRSGVSIHKAIGIDVASGLLQIGRKKLASFGAIIELIQADAEDLPFSSHRFDVVTCSFGIRNIANPSAALSEIHRVLKPNGRCLILEFSMPSQRIRPLFLFYLRKILPRIGGWISKQPEAYRYLNRTIETFPSGEAFLSLMRNENFSNLQTYSMNCGTVTLYIGEKE